MSRANRRSGNGKSVWTPERKADAFADICLQLSLGKSLRAICEAADLPSRVTVMEWMKADGELAQQYALARQLQADFYADEIIEIADNSTVPHERARLQIDARKWLASKLKPKAYGDKIAHVGGSEDDAPIRYVDEADAFTRRIKSIAPRVAADGPMGGAAP